MGERARAYQILCEPFQMNKVQFQKDFYSLKLNRYMYMVLVIIVIITCGYFVGNKNLPALLSLSLLPCTIEMVKNQVKLLRLDKRFNSTYNSETCNTNGWVSESRTVCMLVVFGVFLFLGKKEDERNKRRTIFYYIIQSPYLKSPFVSNLKYNLSCPLLDAVHTITDEHMRACI